MLTFAPRSYKYIKEANKLGDVVVGLLTDKAIASYKKIPYMSYEQRFEVIDGLKYVKKIIQQDTLDYSDNLRSINPDFVVHGDDWKTGIQKTVREKVIKTLEEWGGKQLKSHTLRGFPHQALNRN